MCKPYYIWKRENGFYYASITDSDGKIIIKKSTRTYNKREAEQIAMNWVVNGGIPERTNSKNSKTNTVDKLSLINQLKTISFTQDDINNIISVLQERKYIKTAIVYDTPSAQPLLDYLVSFWDYDTSPYVREKLFKGKSIQRNRCTHHIRRIQKYWYSIVKDKSVGELTRQDVNSIFTSDCVANLAPKTVNEIVSSVTIPMRFAHLNKLTTFNCYDGILKFSVKSKERKVLTLEQAMQLFSVAEWENESAKLANMLALYTSMRQGEIAALRLEDIGLDRIYIRHSWSKYEGLKETKTNECREIKIPNILRKHLLKQASLNPYNEGLKSFIFFGKKTSQPTDPANWRKYLRRALASIGYSNPKEICFHSWRHFWCSRVSDIEKDKRIVMTGSGHKTEFMLLHYSSHLEKERALEKLKQTTDKLFLPILEKAYSLIDTDIIPKQELNPNKELMRCL